MPKTLQKNYDSDISENKETNDKYEKLVAFAQKEIEWVRSTFKWAASIIGLIMIVGIYFTFNNLSDLRSEIRNIQSNIEHKIEKEFDDKKIKTLIETVAKEKIEIVADIIIEKDIDEKLQPHIDRLDESILTSQTDIDSIENTLANINPRLSRLTQEFITFSYLIGNKPEIWSGGMTKKYRDALGELIRSLGHDLKFDADSLLDDITKRERDLSK